MEPVVRFENVSKAFSLYKKKSDLLLDIFSSKKNKREFLALDNISFEVLKGETIGIVGINGSGKSTMSNLLSQVAPPTNGSIKIKGETSLVAISAGLNNFLSGIENIELKCLMHGLSKSEIEKIKPDIIEFADIGEFIHQPIKSYSSGMKSRLGFAISVHIQPDILVIDEALSVGDSTFYQKCLDKFDEFKEQGKTIFFISHSLSQVQSISDRIIWLNFGKIEMFDETEKVVKEYDRFVNWFNELSKNEKKEYRNEMLKGQIKKNKQINSQTIIERRRAKKSKKFERFIVSFQFTLLLVYFILSTILMFIDDPLNAFSQEDTKMVESDRIIDEETNNGELAVDVNAKLVENNGFINSSSAVVYENEDLEYEIGSLNFLDEVYIDELIGDSVYKVNTEYGEGYINSSEVILEDQFDLTPYSSIDDFVFLFPETIVDSYNFFFSFLGEEYDMITGTMQGITDDYVTDSIRVIELSNEGVSYIFNENLTSVSLVIENINLNEKSEEILQQANLSSDTLYYYKLDEYDVVLNLEGGLITFHLNDLVQP